MTKKDEPQPQPENPSQGSVQEPVTWPCGLHMAFRPCPEADCPICVRAMAYLEQEPLRKMASQGQRQAGATNGKIGSDKTKDGYYSLLRQLGTRTKKPRKKTG